MIKGYINVLILTIAVSLLAACGGTSVDSSVKPPVGTPEADAGPDINITEGLQVSLVGAGYDTDGTIASYLWEQTAGTEVTLTGAETATLSFTAPDVNETLTFVLTVTDNDGKSWTDAVNVLVERLPNNPPSANAGINQTVYVDTEVTLRGSGSDTDGDVALFVWEQTAGTTVSLADNTAATTTFTTPSTPGTLSFELTVTDNEGGSTTDSVDINVGLVPNELPTANAGLPQNVLANEIVTLSGEASDSDGSIMSSLWEQIAGIQVEFSDAQSLDTTFTAPSTPTELQFRLTVTDDDGDTRSDTVTVFVDIIVNQIPLANAGIDQTVFVDELVALSGSGSDEDGSVVAYLWEQTSGATVSLNDVNSNSPVFTAPSSADILSFRLTVTDNEGDTHSDSVNIVVQERVNNTPSANAGMDQSVYFGQAGILAGSGSDADGDELSYIWEQTGGVTVSLSDPLDSTPSFTAPNEETVLSFRLTVIDEQGATARDSVNVIVTAVPNSLPTADAGPDQTVDDRVVVTLAGSGSDSDGTIASYLWEQTAGTTVTLNDNTVDRPTFTSPESADILTFRLTVTDDEGGTGTDTVHITVNFVPNVDPVANAGTDQTVYVSTAVSLAGSGSDSDGSIVSYLWEQTAGDTVSLSSTTTQNPSFTAPSTPQTLTFSLTVTDNEGGTHSDTVNVTVQFVPNIPPTANAGSNQTVITNTTVNLSGSGSDSDGSVASYAWSQVSGTSISFANDASAATSFTAPASAATLVLRLTVTDNDGDDTSDDVTITVLPPNVLPTANAGTDQDVLVDGLVFLSGTSSSDSDGSIVSYSWARISGPSETLYSASTATPYFFTPSTPAVFVFRLTVTDDRGGTDTDDVTVTVDYEYEPVQSIPNNPYTEADPLTYNTESDCAGYAALTHPASISGALSAPIYSLEDDLVAVVWGDDYSGLTAGQSTTLTTLQSNAGLQQNVLDSLTELRRFIVSDHKIDRIPNLYSGDGNCYPVIIYVSGTDVYSGDTDITLSDAWCNTGSGVEVPHVAITAADLVEMTSAGSNIPQRLGYVYGKALQCGVGRDEASTWAWYTESFANFIGNDAADATASLALFQQNTFSALDDALSYPGGWTFWMHLANTFGYDFTAEVLQRANNAGESTLEFLRRIAPFDCTDDACRNNAFSNLFGQFAASTVNYVTNTTNEGVDYPALANSAWQGGHRQSAYLHKVGTSRYRIADWQAPQRFGYNIIELIPDDTASEILIGFEGWGITNRESEWRVIVVATTNEAVQPHVEAYREMFEFGTQVIDLSQWETDLGATIQRLHLVIAATPLDWLRDSALSGFTSAARYRELERYVYEVDITGAWPLGHEPESERPAVGVSGTAHSNGGGFVADTATVDVGAYVGPQARVLGSVQVLGNARIEGRAVVQGSATVQGDAVISSSAELNDTALIENHATVRDNALLGDNAIVRNEAKIHGDAVASQNAVISTLAMVYGVPLVDDISDATITGTALTDGASEVTAASINVGTVYDNWSTDASGLLIHYDFESNHTYRIRDVHGSQDAYFLGVNNFPATSVPIVSDAGLSSNVLTLSSNGYVELPKATTDYLNYEIQLYFKWSGGSTTQYLFDATTDQSEQLSMQLLPLPGNVTFKMNLAFSDSDGYSNEAALETEFLDAGVWYFVRLIYDQSINDLRMIVRDVSNPASTTSISIYATDTRDFEYDSLKVRLGGSTSGSNWFSGQIDEFKVIRQ